MVKRELYGKWWIPSSEEEKISGTLKIFDNGNSDLVLYGKFNAKPLNKESCFNNIVTQHYALVNGVTMGDQKITLINCDVSFEETDSSGLKNQTLTPLIVLIGFAFNSIDDIKFDKIRVSFKCLPLWFPQNHFHTKMKENDEHINEFTLTYYYPQKVEFDLEDFHFMINRYLEDEGNLYKTIKLKESANFILDFTGFHDISFLIEHYIRPLRDLLTFSMDIPCFVTSFFVSSSKIKHEIMEMSESITLDIEVINSNNFYSEEPDEDIFSNRFLIKYNYINNNCEQFFKKWFSLYRQIRDIYAFLLSPIYNRNMYLQNIYFNIMQAIEGYHRSLLFNDSTPFFNQDDIEPIVYKEIKKSINECFADGKRVWILNKLQYNEPSLKKRILHLINYVSFKLNIKILVKDKVAKRAAHFRNFLAHPQNKNNLEKDNFNEIILILDFLKNILILNILIELDLNEVTLTKILSNKMNYSFKAIEKYYSLGCQDPTLTE